jgi:peptidyl-prolyl cis-trans isomerase D
MLQNIGDKLKAQRWLATLLLGALSLIFAAWGAYGIVNISFAPQNFGLRVNGERVSVEALNRAWQQRQAQYAQAFQGATISPAQTQTLQQNLLNEYVRSTVLRQRALADGYRASDAEVLKAYESEQAFQVNGKFSAAAAKTMLAQAGLTPAMYEAERRQSIEIGQLSDGIQLSDFMTETQRARIFALVNEQREVRYCLLPAAKYAPVKLDEAQIKSWYEAHSKEFLSPESVRLRYAELSLDGIAAQQPVKEEDLQAWYEKNKSRYSEPERRHAHHILIAPADPKDPKADAEALAKAQQVLAQLKAGKDFGELARKFSSDPGSAAKGGDLGWAEQNAYVAPFADALFRMSPGQISDPVKTQYGYHIIRLDEVQSAHVASLADARARIEADYRREQATEVFGDREEQLQQKLEQAGGDDLAALASQFGMPVAEISNFTRGGAAPLGGKPELVQAVFSEQTLDGHHIGGPVALSQDKIVIFKVLEHHAPAPQPLASVHEEVAAAVRKSASAAASKAAVDGALRQLEGGADFDAVAKGLGVTTQPAAFIGRADPQLPLQLREAAFAAPHPGAKPLYRAIALDDGGAALLELSAVRPGKAGANDKNDQELVLQYENRDRDGAFSAYIEELVRTATVKRNPNLFQ